MYQDANDRVTEFRSDRRNTNRRKRFGIVHYVRGGRKSFLIIPSGIGILPGDRITVYVSEGKVSFRVEKDGVYSVFSCGTTSKALRCVLCPELENFAYHKTRDIVVRTVPGGWTVPLDQFD